jgi:nitroreductase
MEAAFEPLDFEPLSAPEASRRVHEFRDHMRRRRTVREFSPEPVPLELIETAIEAAASAPSGANRQPWRFVIVKDPQTKSRIRDAAETEERDFYERRATEQWLSDLAPLGTDAHKPFLETAPYLIVVFAIDYEPARLGDGTEENQKNYYVQESVGIAVGMLLTALHTAGLATLTHTPSPMRFLNELLDRPKHERPFVLIPVGQPAPNARVPKITKKTLDEIRELV